MSHISNKITINHLAFGYKIRDNHYNNTILITIFGSHLAEYIVFIRQKFNMFNAFEKVFDKRIKD